ncbi:hypothetical protein [Gloeothece citriformis]|uniref:hypothetical protein n=1 Tax=Gloeothece citriformis TaxID=2546356 RepID=UPI0012FEFE3A|nr:hypothetical protein [Gloeothece citriformis]
MHDYLKNPAPGRGCREQTLIRQTANGQPLNISELGEATASVGQKTTDEVESLIDTLPKKSKEVHYI